MQTEDRRAPGVKRVPVERVVEICGRDPSVPAFEAESVELSGRGLRVRTPYLPGIGAPLVCRLEHDGNEIVVEGLVAWRSENDAGGEFGIKFTALDSNSVTTLKELCGIGVPSLASPAEAPAAAIEPRSATGAEPGTAVKLHIEGLGAPMKARVRRGSRSRVLVGSNLEFLRLGRALEVEDVAQKRRAGAEIDTVSIAIDPQTQVPQLVVSLRYEGVEDVTPEPSVVDDEAGDHSVEAPELAARPAPSPPSGEVLDDEDDEDDEEADGPSAMQERLASLAVKASGTARSTAGVLARAGSDVAALVGQLARNAGGKASKVMARRKQGVALRRGKLPAQPAPRLRPQSPTASRRAPARTAVPGDRKTKVKRIALSAVVVAVAIGVGARVFGGEEGAAEPAPQDAAKAQAEDNHSSVAPAAAKVAPAEGAPAKRGKEEAAPTTDQGIVADVPLFGPTPMATLEPAPLAPSEEEVEEPKPPSNVPDESFDDGPTEGTKTWGQGRLHLPFVHRLRLDAAARGFEPQKRSTGFSVLIPGRKLLESGRKIASRDDRIVKVETENTDEGAKVTFVFRGNIPAYKVRLKQRDVEFFISAPHKS